MEAASARRVEGGILSRGRIWIGFETLLALMLGTAVGAGIITWVIDGGVDQLEAAGRNSDRAEAIRTGTGEMQLKVRRFLASGDEIQGIGQSLQEQVQAAQRNVAAGPQAESVQIMAGELAGDSAGFQKVVDLTQQRDTLTGETAKAQFGALQGSLTGIIRGVAAVGDFEVVYLASQAEEKLLLDLYASSSDFIFRLRHPQLPRTARTMTQQVADDEATVNAIIAVGGERRRMVDEVLERGGATLEIARNSQSSRLHLVVDGFVGKTRAA